MNDGIYKSIQVLPSYGLLMRLQNLFDSLAV